MIKCDLCGKECKTAQGLAGHRQFVHGELPGPQLRLEQPDPLVTQSELEQRLDFAAELITKQVQEQVQEQLSELPKQLTQLSAITKQQQLRLDEVTEKLSSVKGAVLVCQGRLDRLKAEVDPILAGRAIAEVVARGKK